jgi:hypothetical protein
MQLRYLSSLNVIAAEKNSTIVFPFPMEFVQLHPRHWRRQRQAQATRNHLNEA